MNLKMKKSAIVFSLILLSCGFAIKEEIQTYKVKQDECVISVVETGELKATRSTMISAPAISWQYGDLKITKLIDDGTAVQPGDTLLQFEQAEVQKAIIDARAELAIAKAEYNKTQADQKSKIENLKADLRMAEISFEISKLELEQAQYEAKIKKREIQLRLQQAEISLNKARDEIQNQEKVNQQELKKLQLKIDQSTANLKEAQQTLAKLTITVPTPRLVIIEKNLFI